MTSTQDSPPLQPGCRVDAQGKVGTVRFVGTTKFAQGEWVGIELDVPEGKNDGTVQGHRYFQCEPLHGLFIKKTQVSLIEGDYSVPSTRVSKLPTRTSRRSSIRPRSSNGEGTTEVDGTKGEASQVRRSSRVGTRRSTRLSMSQSPGQEEATTEPKNRSRRTSIAPTGSDSSSKSSKEKSLATRETEAEGGSNRSSPTITKREEQTPQKVNEEDSKMAAVQISTAREAETAAVAIPDNGSENESTSRPQQSDSTGNDSQNTKDSTAQQREIAEGGIQEGLSTVPQLLPNFSREEFEQKLADSIKEIHKEADERIATIESQLNSRLASASDKEAQQKTRIAELEAELGSYKRARSEHDSETKKLAVDLAQLSAKYSSSQRRIEELENQIEELQEMLELGTLDKETLETEKEIAEERVAVLEEQIEALKEANSLHDSLSQSSSSSPPTADGSQDINASLAPQEENARLRKAIRSLHDKMTNENSSLTKKVRELERIASNQDGLVHENAEQKAQINSLKREIAELKDMLDVANSFESMVEALTEKNLVLGERVVELESTIASLEAIRDIADEVESQHAEYEKQLNVEKEKLEQRLSEAYKVLTTQQGTLSEKDKTILKYKQLVETLKSELNSSMRQAKTSTNVVECSSKQGAQCHNLSMKNLEDIASEFHKNWNNLLIARMESTQLQQQLTAHKAAVESLANAEEMIIFKVVSTLRSIVHRTETLLTITCGASTPIADCGSSVAITWQLLALSLSRRLTERTEERSMAQMVIRLRNVVLRALLILKETLYKGGGEGNQLFDDGNLGNAFRSTQKRVNQIASICTKLWDWFAPIVAELDSVTVLKASISGDQLDAASRGSLTSLLQELPTAQEMSVYILGLDVDVDDDGRLAGDHTELLETEIQYHDALHSLIETLQDLAAQQVLERGPAVQSLRGNMIPDASSSLLWDGIKNAIELRNSTTISKYHDERARPSGLSAVVESDTIETGSSINDSLVSESCDRRATMEIMKNTMQHCVNLLKGLPPSRGELEGFETGRFTERESTLNTVLEKLRELRSAANSRRDIVYEQRSLWTFTGALMGAISATWSSRANSFGTQQSILEEKDNEIAGLKERESLTNQTALLRHKEWQQGKAINEKLKNDLQRAKDRAQAAGNRLRALVLTKSGSRSNARCDPLSGNKELAIPALPTGGACLPNSSEETSQTFSQSTSTCVDGAREGVPRPMPQPAGDEWRSLVTVVNKELNLYKKACRKSRLRQCLELAHSVPRLDHHTSCRTEFTGRTAGVGHRKDLSLLSDLYRDSTSMYYEMAGSWAECAVVDLQAHASPKQQMLSIHLSAARLEERYQELLDVAQTALPAIVQKASGGSHIFGARNVGRLFINEMGTSTRTVTECSPPCQTRRTPIVVSREELEHLKSLFAY